MFFLIGIILALFFAYKINTNKQIKLSQDVILVDKDLTSKNGSELVINNNSLLDYNTEYNLTITNNSSVKYTVVLFSNEFEKDAIYCEPNSSITITGKTSELIKNKEISVSSKDGSSLDGYAVLKLIKNNY